MSETTSRWVGGSGDWNDAAGWSPSGVPTNTTTANIKASGEYEVTIIAPASVYWLTLDTPNVDSGLVIESTLTIASKFVDTSGMVLLDSGGTIVGGNLSEGAGGDFVFQGGTLQGVTYVGLLQLAIANEDLNIIGGIDVEATSTGGVGTMDVTGAGDQIAIDNTTTLANLDINLGSTTGSNGIFFQYGGNETLTLASSVALDQVGTAYISIGSTDKLVNAGTMTISDNNSYFSMIGSGDFVNKGTITIDGGSLDASTGAFSNSGTITILAGGSLQVNSTLTNSGTINDDQSGGLQLQGALTNNGTINVTGEQEIYGNVYGSGTISMDAQLQLDGTVAAGQTIRFNGVNELLQINNHFAGTLSNLALGDALIFNGANVTAIAIVGGDLVITAASGKTYDYALTNTSLTSATQITFAAGPALPGQYETVISIGGSSYTLTAGATIDGGDYNNLIIATSIALTSTDNIDAGSGYYNVLELSGIGTFNLAAPASLTGITYIVAKEGQVAGGGVAGTRQTIYSRAGLNATIAVGSRAANSANPNPLGIVIHGANDSVTFEMSNATGIDEIYLGSAEERVKGSDSTGQVTVVSSIANASADVEGGGNNETYATAGLTSLDLSTGGTLILNQNDQNMTVVLSGATNLMLGGANFIVVDGGTGNDTITAGGQEQALSGGGGTNTLIGFNNDGDLFFDTSAHLNGDTIENFGGSGGFSDSILATDMNYIGQTATFTEALSGNHGTLSFSDGTNSVSMTLTGSFSSSDFSLSAGVSGGVLVTLV